MKKVIIILSVFISILQAQDKTFSFKPENSLFHDEIDCIIGSKIRLDDVFVNLNSVEKIDVGIFSMSGNFIKSIEYKDSLTSTSPRTLLVKINYILDYDAACYLVIKVIVRDYFSKILYTGYDYWIVKPRYPVLTPIIQDTLFCGTKASFSFAALGLDEDLNYSYEIDTSGTNIVNGKGSIIILDSLLNTESLFKKNIKIKGFYKEKPFKYKHNSNEERINNSEWETIILGPGPEHLVCNSSYKEYDGDNSLYLTFNYKVGDKPYFPLIDYKYSVFNETKQKPLIIGRDVFLIGTSIIVKSSQNYLGKLIVEFRDQYNEIKIPFEIKE